MLDKWIKENNLRIGDVAQLVGCSRTTIHKVLNGVPIQQKFADKILEITDGYVKVDVANPGRRV